jgi:hypothetical protein
MIPFLKLMGVTSSQLSPFCKEFTTIVELKEVYVLCCPRTFTYNVFVGMEDEEEMETVENDGGELAMVAYVAAKIKEFATAAAAAMDDDDADESKKENDEDNDDGVYRVLPSVTKGEKGWILHWKVAKSYGKPLLTW